MSNVTIEITIDNLKLIINALARGPYIEVYELINYLHEKMSEKLNENSSN